MGLLGFWLCNHDRRCAWSRRAIQFIMSNSRASHVRKRAGAEIPTSLSDCARLQYFTNEHRESCGAPNKRENPDRQTRVSLGERTTTSISARSHDRHRTRCTGRPRGLASDPVAGGTGGQRRSTFAERLQYRQHILYRFSLAIAPTSKMSCHFSKFASA